MIRLSCPDRLCDLPVALSYPHTWCDLPVALSCPDTWCDLLVALSCPDTWCDLPVALSFPDTWRDLPVALSCPDTWCDLPVAVPCPDTCCDLPVLSRTDQQPDTTTLYASFPRISCNSSHRSFSANRSQADGCFPSFLSLAGTLLRTSQVRRSFPFEQLLFCSENIIGVNGGHF